MKGESNPGGFPDGKFGALLLERYREALEQIDAEGREFPKRHCGNRSDAWEDGNAAGLHRAGEHARAALAFGPDSEPEYDDDEDQEPDSDRTLGLY